MDILYIGQNYSRVKDYLVDYNVVICEDFTTYDIENSDIVIIDCNTNETIKIFTYISEEFPQVPIIILTGILDSDIGQYLIDQGAQDYIPRIELTKSTLDRSILYAYKRKNLENRYKKTVNKLDLISKGFINSVLRIIDSRDPYTAGHQKRVQLLAKKIAEKMNLSEERIEAITFASVVHDVGKIYVPSELLSSPRELNKSEMNIIKYHPEVGYNILKGIEFPWDIAEIVKQHHERLDGSGYPKGLVEKDILLEAKVIAVADTVEAMMNHRPYRPKLGIKKALDEIEKNKSVKYDSKIVDTCIDLFEEFEFE